MTERWVEIKNEAMRRVGSAAAPSLPMALRLLNPARVCLFWIGFALVSAVWSVWWRLFIILPCTLSPRFRQRNYVRLWNRFSGSWGVALQQVARVATGVELRVEGQSPPGRHLVVANHQSTLDIVMLFSALREMNLKFVAKKELTRFIPIVSPALRMAGFGIVDFADSRRTLKSLAVFARSMAGWEGSPVLYPEGERTQDGSISPFRPAGLKLLVKESALPVLPVIVDGLWNARTIRNFFLHLPGSCCRIRILPPIPNAEAMADLEGFPKRLETRMREELDRMRREDSGPEIP